MVLWNSCNKKVTIIRVLQKSVLFMQVMLDSCMQFNFHTIEHENKLSNLRIGRPRIIRNEDLWRQAGQWLIAEQIKEQNLLVMQWGALRWMCGQDPKGKCKRGSQTLTHLEAHKNVST